MACRVMKDSPYGGGKEQDRLQKQNHEDRLRGRVANYYRYIPDMLPEPCVCYFFFEVFFAFLAGAFFVAIIHHPPSL